MFMDVNNKYAHIERWRMPAVIILDKEDKDAINWSSYYYIEWNHPNQAIGTFRACPLAHTPCRNKGAVMTALRNAYNGPINVEHITLRSFADAVAFCNHMGLRICWCHSKKEKPGTAYDYLTR